MANQTITTNKTISEVITDGLGDGDNITINSGAILTIDISPTVLVGQITVNNGECLVDGENATDPIIFCGEQNTDIVVSALGTFTNTKGWWTHPTTGDGTADQTFDMSTYFTDDAGNNITSDVFSGVWVETGRRIDYDTDSGTTPIVGDWIFKSNDNDVHGRIVEVNTGSSYIVVKFLTGALVDNDDIEVQKVVDSDGPLMSKSWTAKVNNASGDIREAGIFQGFANCRQNGTDNLTSMGSGMSGLVFQQTHGNNTITFGDGTNGFIVPNGAEIRLPMVHMCTSTTAQYSLGSCVMASESETSRYGVNSTGTGHISIEGLSIGSGYVATTISRTFIASSVSANLTFGCSRCTSEVTMEDLIICGDLTANNYPNLSTCIASVDSLEGITVSDSMICLMQFQGLGFGGQTSNNITLNKNICISNGASQFQYCKTVRINDLTFIGHTITISGGSDIEIKNLKYQNGIDPTVKTANEMMAISSATSDILIQGIHILNNSGPNGDDLLDFTDIDGATIECMGFIDDKYDIDTAGARYFIYTGGITNSVKINRVFLETGTNKFMLFTGPENNTIINNCSGGYGAEVEVGNSQNIQFRGVHGASGVLGSSTGVETNYDASAGGSFYDIFRSDTTGALGFLFQGGSQDNPITGVVGSPSFTLDGMVDMVSGEEFIQEMPYSAKGHLTFTGSITTCNYSTATEGVQTHSNLDLEFQYDTGSGYNGSWLDLETAGNLTAITGMVSGIKLKVKFVATGTVTNLSGLQIHTTTTITDQSSNLHNTNESSVQITGPDIADGTRVQVWDLTSGTELLNESTSGGLTATTATFTDGGTNLIRYRASRQAGAVAEVEDTTLVLTSTGLILGDTLSEVPVYAEYNVDGSTVTEFTFDSGNLEVDINDSDNTTVIQRIGAWYYSEITTEVGIRSLFGNIDWESLNSIKIPTGFTLQLDNTKATPLILTGGRLYREDGVTIIDSASNSIHIDYDPVYTVGGGITSDDVETACGTALSDYGADTITNVKPSIPI